MRKIFFLISLVLVVAFGAMAAQTLSLTDGATFSGEITKIDDTGLLLRLPGDAYSATNISWSRLSQDSLKQLAANPKIKPFAEVFIEPDASQRPAKPEIQINPVTRLTRPENPSLIGGLFGSPLGLFLLLVLYAANLYAAVQVAIVRARPPAVVIGLAAVLPIFGPIIFLMLPVQVAAPPEENNFAAPAGTAGAAAQRSPEEIQIVEASWRKDEKKPEAQIFARGKFTFNKRFVETKFAGFVGSPKGDALKFSMEVKTATQHFAIEHILQVAATDVMFETVASGQVTVALNDILEIKLIPKPA